MTLFPFKKRYNFIYKTLQTPNKISLLSITSIQVQVTATLIGLKKQGYQTKLIYLAISDVEICLSRVNERFISGRGHNVDEATIYQRYKDSLFHLETNLKWLSKNNRVY